MADEKKTPMEPTPGEPTKKPRKPQGPRKPTIPDGHKEVKFILTDDEYAKLHALGDQDDRDANGLAKVLARRHVRNSTIAAS